MLDLSFLFPVGNLRSKRRLNILAYQILDGFESAVLPGLSGGRQKPGTDQRRGRLCCS